jgi:membrane protein implicated in regulation of membrane protease activity
LVVSVTAVYGFFAVVGGVLVLVMLIGVGDADTDFDADVDLDLDLDADTDLDLSPHDVTSSAGSVLQSLFSFRTLVFVSAFFGITGLVLPLTGAGDVTTFVSAVAVGGVAGFVNDRLIRYVKRTSGGISDRTANLAGRSGRVSLPVSTGRRGQVIVEVEGHTMKLVAEPFGNNDFEFDQGDRVVVVEVDHGVARVAPLELE